MTTRAVHSNVRRCAARLKEKAGAFLLCLLFLSAGFAGKASEDTDKVTLVVRNEKLSSVLKQIEKQTGYRFAYSNSTVPAQKTVSLEVVDKELSEVLNLLLKDLGLVYQMEADKLIVIFPKKAAPKLELTEPPADSIIAGRITGPDGRPIEGASVSVKGTSIGTTTNKSGEFRLAGVRNNAVLVISSVGYESQEMAASAVRPTTAIVLREDASTMQNVVVTGYQTIQKKLFTGAATKLKAEDVKMDGVLDVSRMLEGRAAGVSVQNVSGTFGTAPKVRVRGATSITGENKPLWVVDGIVLEDIVNISNDQLSSGDPNTLLGSAVAGLNANDIQSFEILKDASATALYGARAMNGVIVITTKKGRSGKPQINYNGNFTVFLKPSYSNYNILNSADQMSVYSEMQRKGWLNFSDVANASNGGVFTKMWNEIKRYDETAGAFGLENTPEARAAFLRRYATANTDWFDLLFRNSLTQEHSLNISSGADNAQYYFSTSFYNDQGWSLGDNVKRYTANMRSNYRFSDRLSGGIITTASVRQQQAPGTTSRVSNTVEGKYTRDFDINPFSYALNTSRVLTAYDQNGNREFFTSYYAPFNILNELENNSINLKMMDLKLQGELGYKFGNNLEYKILGAIRYVKTSREHKIRENSNMALAYRANYNSVITGANRFLYLDPDAPDVEKQVVLPRGGFYNRTEDELMNYNIRNLLTWKKDFGTNHTLNLLAGQEVKYTNRQNAFNNGFGYQYDRGGIPFTDYRIVKQMLEGNYNYFGMSMNYDRFVAFFSNASYAYKEKYVFNGTLRYDGSNRMGKSAKARWLPTWTLSAAWNVEQEDFLRNAKAIDFLKLRAAYGLTASLGNATNSTVVLQNSTTNRPYLSDAESQITISQLENSELTWEKQYEANVGVDLGLAQGRITLTVDGYKRNGFDLIGSVRTSGIGGQSSKIANYAEMTSHGLEVTLGTRIVKTKDWNYTTNLTFGYNVNKITNLKNNPRIYDLIMAEGGPLEGHAVRGLYSIPFLGLDDFSGIPNLQNESGKTGTKVNVQSRETQYLKYEGPVDPTITGGFNNTLTYKNLSANVFFSYQAGNKIRLTPVYRSGYTDLDAMPKEFLDRWTLPGDEKFTYDPALASLLTSYQLSDDGSYIYSNYNYSSARVADGSFIRLKTASLQYSLSPSWLSAIHAKNLSLGIVATNLWLIYADKKLQGQDPEFFASGGVALPMPKQFTLSVKLGY